MRKLLITINTFITMIITTTSIIQDAEEIKYLEVVSTNIVVGTNFFSDFAASFTDIFGGNSYIYEEKLRGIYNQAMSELSRKANRIGANAIVGLQIDFDEVSGKGKSMFMVSALGTAALVKMKDHSTKDNERSNSMYVSKNDVEIKLLNNYYKNHFKTTSPLHPDIETIISKGLSGFEEELFELYVKINISDFYGDKESKIYNCTTLLEYLFSKMSYKDACDFLYSKLNRDDSCELALYHIKKASLFNPKRIIEFTTVQRKFLGPNLN